MKQLIPFIPNGITPFGFATTIGGTKYFIRVLYNNYSNRYYVQATDTNNQVAFFTPMIGSPEKYDINLALVLGSGLLVYRKGTNNFEAL